MRADAELDAMADRMAKRIVAKLEELGCLEDEKDARTE